MRKYILILLVLLTLLLAACGPGAGEAEREIVVSPQPQAEGTPDSSASGEGTAFDPTTMPSVQLRLENPLQGQELEIWGTQLRQESDGLHAEVCFRYPPGRDWYAGPAELRTATQEWTADSWILENSPESLAEGGERCGEYIFPDVTQAPAQADTVVVVSFIGESLPPGGECAKILEEVQPALDSQGLGLRLECQQVENDYQVTLTGKPESAEAAGMLVRMYYTLTGPWTVTFQAP